MTEVTPPIVFAPLLRSPTPPLAIGESDYGALRTARSVLLGVLEIEDNFACLVENFLEFEEESLTIAVRRLVTGTFTRAAVRRDRLAVARRLSNVLASARAFLDQTDRTFLHRFSESRAAVRSERHGQYDARLGYRVMEELRNVVTHEGRGLHRMSYDHSRNDQGLEVRVLAILDAADLKPFKVKQAVLNDLEAAGPRHAVGTLLREYLEGLGAVHARARALSEVGFASAADTFESWLQQGAARWGEQPGFEVIRHEAPADRFQVVRSFLESCRLAREDRYLLTNLPDRFVSSQARL